MSFLLKALNTLDAALSLGRTGPVVRGLAYGSEKRQRLDIYSPRGDGGRRTAGAGLLLRRQLGFGRQKRIMPLPAGPSPRWAMSTVLPDYTHTHERPYPAFMDGRRHCARLGEGRISPDYGGDPDRIAVAGHSAGAYIAATLALDRRWGAADAIRAGIGLAGPYDFLPFDSPVTERTFGHVPDLPATQPVNHVRANTPPLLLATGDADTTVRPGHSVELAKRLQAAGGAAELILYPGVTHTGPLKAIARPFRGHAPVLQDIAEFLKERGLGA